MTAPHRIACIGECLIELSAYSPADQSARVAIAGDTLNTAVSLKRLLGAAAEVSYVTAVGTDRFSDQMVAEMEAEDLRTDHVVRHPDRIPGLYAIELDAEGERSFRYWRSEAAARTLFSEVGDLDLLKDYDVLYLSAISLAILPEAVRWDVVRACAARRAAGATVVFDSNYRPRLWSSAEAARDVLAAMWEATSIALPSHDDEQLLYPDELAAETLVRVAGSDPGREVALKRGAEGPLLWKDGPQPAALYARAERVVDTTGAGDGFNAGYLAARLSGADPAEAARAGHAHAMHVIATPGAIPPKAASAA
ncbi:MAG: sugar kinase [Pseudomonadota bacterium]